MNAKENNDKRNVPGNIDESKALIGESRMIIEKSLKTIYSKDKPKVVSGPVNH